MRVMTTASMLLSGLIAAARDGQDDELVAVLGMQNDDTLFELAMTAGQHLLDAAFENLDSDIEIGPFPIFPDSFDEVDEEDQMFALRQGVWLAALASGQRYILDVIWSGLDTGQKHEHIMCFFMMSLDEEFTTAPANTSMEIEHVMESPFFGALISQVAVEINDDVAEGVLSGEPSDEVFSRLADVLDATSDVIAAAATGDVDFGLEECERYISSGGVLFALVLCLVPNISNSLSLTEDLSLEMRVYAPTTDDEFLRDRVTPLLTKMLDQDPDAIDIWQELDMDEQAAACEHLVRIFAMTTAEETEYP